MRAILSLALAAGLVASAAVAQVPIATEPPPVPERAAGYDEGRLVGGVEHSDRYEMRLIALKKKVDRQTREDGGQLTPEHQAGLQKQFDDLNSEFGLASRRLTRSD